MVENFMISLHERMLSTSNVMSDQGLHCLPYPQQYFQILGSVSYVDKVSQFLGKYGRHFLSIFFFFLSLYSGHMLPSQTNIFISLIITICFN